MFHPQPTTIHPNTTGTSFALLITIKPLLYNKDSIKETSRLHAQGSYHMQKTLNFQALSENVRRDLLENHTEQEIEWMSVGEAFDAYLSYNGIIGYSDTIRAALFNIITSSTRTLALCDGSEIEELQKHFGLETRQLLTKD